MTKLYGAQSRVCEELAFSKYCHCFQSKKRRFRTPVRFKIFTFLNYLFSKNFTKNLEIIVLLA